MYLNKKEKLIAWGLPYVIPSLSAGPDIVVAELETSSSPKYHRYTGRGRARSALHVRLTVLPLATDWASFGQNIRSFPPTSGK